MFERFHRGSTAAPPRAVARRVPVWVSVSRSPPNTCNSMTVESVSSRALRNPACRVVIELPVDLEVAEEA